MCQYSAVEGDVTDWHLVHLGALATGGAGLIVAESTGVTSEGRISPFCAGIWRDSHVESWSRVVRFIHRQRTPVALQLAHAGRKGSTSTPWTGEMEVPIGEGGWQTIAPSAVPYGDLPVPWAMTVEELGAARDAFVTAAGRALAAGFDAVELHAAHGYLLHEFLSPLTNRRDDRYGGSLENRMRFPLEVVTAVRNAWPGDRALFVRISTTSWTRGTEEIEESVEFACRLRDVGVDLVDCSSGGLVPDADIPGDEDYQTSLAGTVRRRAGVRTSAVGRIATPELAEALVAAGAADAVMLGRAMLRNPRWALAAADRLGEPVSWPLQYGRARSRAADVGSFVESAS